MTPQDGRASLKKILTSVKGIILSAGALAAAIGSVLALLPKHEHPQPVVKQASVTQEVSFSDVEAGPEISLNEFEERLKNRASAMVTPSYRLAAYVALDSTKTSTTTTESTPEELPPEPAPGPSKAVKVLPPPKTAATTRFVAPPPSQTPAKEVKGVHITEGTGASQSSIAQAIKEIPGLSVPKTSAAPGEESSSPPGEGAALELPSKCSQSSCAATSTIEWATRGQKDPREAAQELIKVFTDSRNEVVGNKLYPIGEEVRYTIHMLGFAGKKVILEFSLWPLSRRTRLPGSWLHEVIQRQYEPKREDQLYPARFWIPAPSAKGSYYLALTAYNTDSEPLREVKTNIFH